jgi:hypothetical protein
VFEAGAVGDAVVAELVCAARAVSVAQGRLLTALVAVHDASPAPEYAAVEVASALRWTPIGARSQVAVALDLVRRLPAVGAALCAGDIDLPRARVIADEVSTLDVALARHIAAKVLPSALKLSTGQLRARLAKLVISADPATAVKRHRKRVSERRVVFEPTPDGCANVLGLDLSADEALRALRNLTQLARSLKAAGDPRSMDQLRADTFVRLLCGQSVGRGSVELTVSLPVLAELSQNPGTLAGYGPVVAEIARKVASAQADGKWTYTVRDPETGEVAHGTLRTRPTTPTPAEPDPATAESALAPAESGPLSGKAARDPAESGLSSGRAARDPAESALASGKSACGSKVSSTMSTPRSSASANDYGTTDSARASWNPNREVAPSRGRDDSQAKQDTACVPRQGPQQGARPECSAEESPRKAPAGMRREVVARDRTCRAPGCRVPATACDLDHGVSWASGGRTSSCNLTPLCRYHHRAKHEGGWRYRRQPNGIVTWLSPLGHTYRTYPESDDDDTSGADPP